MNSLPAKMRAVIWEGPERLRETSLDIPSMQSTKDALIKVSHASTCGTDLHIYRGAVPNYETGTVIGHEFVGTVVAIGSDVQNIETGQRVRCSDFTACGKCKHCLAGRHAQCNDRMLFGFSGIQKRLDGCMAEYVRVPWADVTLTPMKDDMDPRAGLLAADILPTALGALGSLVTANHRVAIIGAGPVGVLTAFLARLRGASVTLLEANPHRADRARRAGFDLLEVDAGLSLEHESVGQFDIVIDALGGERGLTAALVLVRSGGFVIGIGSQAGRFALDWGRIFQREISIRFVIGNPIGMRTEIDDVLSTCAPVLDLMFSDSVSLSDVPEYFAALYRRERFKAIVNIDSGTESKKDRFKHDRIIDHL